MKKWVQGYQVRGSVKEAVEGTRSLLLLTRSDSGVSQLSYLWDGGTSVEITDSAMGMIFEEETVNFQTPDEAKAYIVEKAENSGSDFSLRIDIPEQVKVDRARALEKEEQK
ncbi:hypothetical protein [Selenomonas noxia]|jgi:hypothetical protein|uniref:hypothetical protein n=1 Tax=Selenomonas noxia TaxID=135083 RepID=UPI00288C254D|nr:hypothetical protein [Selenomonas noxia]